MPNHHLWGMAVLLLGSIVLPHVDVLTLTKSAYVVHVHPSLTEYM